MDLECGGDDDDDGDDEPCEAMAFFPHHRHPNSKVDRASQVPHLLQSQPRKRKFGCHMNTNLHIQAGR